MDLIRTFVQVVKLSSFTRAARLLGVTPSLVSKRVAELERTIGAQLLVRTTRRIQPTDYGTRYFTRAYELVQRYDELARDATRFGEYGGGLIRIASPTSMGMRYVGPLLQRFRERHEGMRFDLVLIDRFVDPIAEDFDLVLSDQPYVLPTVEFTEEPLCPVRRIVVASPAYLARRGTPRHPRELVHHDCIHYTYLSSGENWIFEGDTGELAVGIVPAFSTSNALIMRSIAVTDGGIAMVPYHVVRDDLTSGALVELFTGFRIPEQWLVAILPPMSRISRRVQGLVKHLRAAFSPPPWEAERSSGRPRGQDAPGEPGARGGSRGATRRA
jgi:DNA-binding transcriptional LysR family regulator